MPDEQKNEGELEQNVGESPIIPTTNVTDTSAVSGEPTAETSPSSAIDTPTDPIAIPAVSAAERVVAEPVATAPTVDPATPVAPKKRRGWVFVSAIVAAALVVFGGGGALAYNGWYQNPQKVVLDAVVSAITAKTVSLTGNLTIEEADYTAKIDISARNSLEGDASLGVKIDYTSDEGDYTIDGEGIWGVSGDLYVKVNDVQELLTSFQEQVDAGVESETSTVAAPDIMDSFGAVVDEVDGKWIKISAEDLGDYSETFAKTQKCFGDLSQKLDSDADFRKTVEAETTELYKNYPFVVIGNSLGSKDVNGVGSLGYELVGDEKVADEFFTNLANTELGKKVEACNDDISLKDFVLSDDATSDDEQVDTSKSEIWISRFGHQITEVNVKSGKYDDTRGSGVLYPVFNKENPIDIPTDTVSMKKVIEDIDTAYNAYLEAYNKAYFEAYYGEDWEYYYNYYYSDDTATQEESLSSSLFN